jgi:hypothetical protein
MGAAGAIPIVMIVGIIVLFVVMVIGKRHAQRKRGER